MARSRVRFKAEDIWDTPEDGNRYEVIDGELYVTPPPVFSHQNVVSNLLAVVAPVVRRDNLGKIVPAPVGVVLGPEAGVQPDIVFVRRERFDIISERGIEGAPDLVVEVLSPSTRGRDQGVKMRQYETQVSPTTGSWTNDAPALETYELSPEGYRLTGTYGPGGVLRSDLFPGLDIRLDDVWS